MRFTDLANNLADALFPRDCSICGARLSGGRICVPCFDELPWNTHACPVCADPVPAPVSVTTPCGSCQRRPLPVTRVLAPLVYRFPVDAVLKGLKFHNRLDVSPMLAELLAPSIWDSGERYDALVPVPLHRWRHARRGYNQAEEIARALSRLTGIPVHRAVRRRRATAPQAGLNARRRRGNLHGAFSVRRTLSRRHVLIVDDVITTGETIRAVARALHQAGADRVSAAAVARAVTGDVGS